MTNRNKAQLFIVIVAASKSAIQKYRGNESKYKVFTNMPLSFGVGYVIGNYVSN